MANASVSVSVVAGILNYHLHCHVPVPVTSVGLRFFPDSQEMETGAAGAYENATESAIALVSASSACAGESASTSGGEESASTSGAVESGSGNIVEVTLTGVDSHYRHVDLSRHIRLLHAARGRDLLHEPSFHSKSCAFRQQKAHLLAGP